MFRRLVTARRILIWRTGELVLVLALGGVVVLLSFVVQDVRRQIVQRQLKVERELESVGAVAALEAELDQRQADIEQIVAYLPDEVGIGSAVAALEREAGRYDVALKIPVVQKVQDGDEGEGEGRTGGPLRDVQLQVVVSGAPEQVLRFFHAVEYLPYLLQVKQWRFNIAATTAPGSTSAVPSGGPGMTRSSAGVAEGRLADLTLDIFLTILEVDDEGRS